MLRLRPWLAVLALGLGPAASAAGLQVTPIMLEIARKDASAVLWLANTGSDALHAQVRVVEWTQTDHEDRLDTTRDLVASPPLLEVAAGARQLVRIVRTSEATPDARERSFRLLVDELPGQDRRGQGGVQFLMRYSVPVFIAADDPQPAPRLEWRLRAEPPALEAVNTGSARAQLSEVAIVDAAGQRTVLSDGLLGYVLAGAQMRWPLPPGRPLPADARLHARINGEPLDRPIAIVDGR
ncbi:MAG TPA: molecular chaperone [Dokdonella sp.]|uniref:fimbrial biogenesis chaperone n=1 Tax=Dokdonella sp. TaxID=2291710 RepID=UPI002D02F49D|nr:molecular chaperone [Dokdonella sp.]HUD42840.1 molecular chaperone [Dokdonella sp.]